MSLDVLFATAGTTEAIGIATMWATWAGALASAVAAIATVATAIIALCIANGQRYDARKKALDSAMALAIVHAHAVTQTLRDQASLLGLNLDENDPEATSDHVLRIAGVVLGDVEYNQFIEKFFRAIPPSIELAAEAAPKFPFTDDAISIIKLHGALDALTRALAFMDRSNAWSKERTREVARVAIFQMRETYNRMNDFVRARARPTP